MSAWDAGSQEEKIEDVEKKFEDNFVTLENRDFQKLEDSEQYLQNLESRLRKLKKDPSVLQQLKEKREECLNNLINSSSSYRTEEDIQLDQSVTPNEIIRHLIPAQAHSVGEIAHLIQHDALDHQKQEQEEEKSPEQEEEQKAAD